MQNLYEENYKALLRDIQQSLNIWKDFIFKKNLIQIHIQNLEIPVSILTGSVCLGS